MSVGQQPDGMQLDSLQPEICLLLSPRAIGGHEAALFGWLADAMRTAGLRVQIVAPDATLQHALRQAGLGTACQQWPPADMGMRADAGLLQHSARLHLLRRLADWPKDKPLLLAPGVLHVAAWLLAAALLRRHRVWVYVPMTHTAATMGFRCARLRDALLRPWVQHVEAWITPSRQQAAQLSQAWGVRTRVHVLPNVARLVGAAPPRQPADADGRLRIAWVGRFDLHQKGLDWLAGVLQNDSWFTERCTWRFQGPGSDAPLLQTLAARLGHERVQVHAHAPIDEALRCSDLLLMCSRFEGVPLVALEATTLGWAVVATRESGLSDCLHDDCLFNFGDIDGLRRALQRMASPTARQAAVAHATARLGPNALRGPYQRALAGVCRGVRAAPRGVVQ
jgi:hypothetical protein